MTLKMNKKKGSRIPALWIGQLAICGNDSCAGSINVRFSHAFSFPCRDRKLSSQEVLKPKNEDEVLVAFRRFRSFRLRFRVRRLGF